MATAQTFTANPASVDPGGTVTFTATFAVDPGTPDEQLNGELRNALGEVAATAVITILNGTGLEPDPSGYTVVVGTGVGTITGFTGTRNSPSLYTAVWTWLAP